MALIKLLFIKTKPVFYIKTFRKHFNSKLTTKKTLSTSVLWHSLVVLPLLIDHMYLHFQVYSSNNANFTCRLELDDQAQSRIKFTP